MERWVRRRRFRTFQVYPQGLPIVGRLSVQEPLRRTTGDTPSARGSRRSSRTSDFVWVVDLTLVLLLMLL